MFFRLRQSVIEFEEWEKHEYYEGQFFSIYKWNSTFLNDYFIEEGRHWKSVRIPYCSFFKWSEANVLATF